MNASPPPITSSRWGARTKRMVVIASLIVLGILLWNLIGIFPLIVVAMLLSYLLWPLVNFIEQRMLFLLPFRTRSLAVVLTFIAVIALFVVVIIGIVPLLLRQLADIGRNLPQFIDVLETELEILLSRPITISGRPVLFDGEPIILLERIQALTGSADGINIGDPGDFDVFQIVGTFLSSLGDLTGPAFSVLGGAVNIAFNLTFLIVIMFYMMRDGEYFIQQTVRITPDAYKGDVRRLFYELGKVWDAYLRGQLILCVSVGVAVYLAALLLGLPNAPILGLIAGVLEFIPNLGPVLALLPALVIALLSESSTLPFLSGTSFALVVIITWAGIQQLESIILVPRVMGGSLNLHPVVVILAVIAGASIGGALGVILAAPFTASARLLGQYIYGKVFDINPFPNPKPPAQTAPKKLNRTYSLVRLYNAPVVRRLRRRNRADLPTIQGKPQK